MSAATEQRLRAALHGAAQAVPVTEASPDTVKARARRPDNTRLPRASRRGRLVAPILVAAAVVAIAIVAAALATTSSAPPSSGSVATCVPAKLRASVQSLGSAGGEDLTEVIVKNAGGQSCHLDGYATLAAYGYQVAWSSGAPIGPGHTLTLTVAHGPLYARTDPGPHRVTLAPGRAAIFYVGAGVNFSPGQGNYKITEIRVGYAGARASITVTVPKPGLAAISPTGQPVWLGITAFQAA